MFVKVKKLHKDAILPKKSHDTDAGYDLVAVSDPEVTETYVQYRTGLSIAPPVGYHTEIVPRSSITKTDLVLANSIGIVDNGYRGELLVRFKIVPRSEIVGSYGPIVRFFPDFRPEMYKKGDRIAQLIVRKTEIKSFVFEEDLPDSERGEGGWGSTGN